MAKVSVGGVYGDLYVVERDDSSKLKNGTYMFRCTCTNCGAEQLRAHGNLLTSRHPRCLFCNTTKSKALVAKKQRTLNPLGDIAIIWRKDSTYLTSIDVSVPGAIDKLTVAQVNWLLEELPEMVIAIPGQPITPLKGVNYHALREIYALRKVFPNKETPYELPKLEKALPKILETPPTDFNPEAQIQAEMATFNPPPSPLRDEYLTIESRDFRFFNHDHPLRPEDVPPTYLQTLVGEFEKKYGDIADYTFSSSPAPGNQLFIYWTKPTNTVPPLEWEPVELAPVSIVSVEDDKAMVVSTFNWNENPGL